MHPNLQTLPSLPLFPDPCANRHKGNQRSAQAFTTVDVTKGQQLVLDALSVAPMTRKEIAAHLWKPLHAVSGRCSELLMRKKVRETGAERDGSGELEIVAKG